MRVPLPLLLLPWLSLAWAANFSVPSTWRNTSSIFTRDEKISLAQGAIDQFIKLGYPAGSIHAAVSGFPIDLGTVLELLPMLALIARKDLVTNSDSNRAYVTGEMNALVSNDTWLMDSQVDIHFSPTTFSTYAMACIEVFKAYGDDQYVDKTLQVWTKIQSGQVNARDSSSNDPLTCNGTSIVGAMSDAGPAATDANPEWTINGAASGEFLYISAMLAEVRSSSAVVEAADTATTAWQTFLVPLSPQKGCIFGELITSPKTCGPPASTSTVSFPNQECSPYGTAGAAISASVWNNASIQETIGSQIVNFLRSPFIPPTGVINETVLYGFNDTAPDVLSAKYGVMYPLIEVWNRSASQVPELASLLETFTNVQINAMMANATIAGSNIYAANWTGPPSSTYRLDAMSGAIAALVAAIGPAPASTPSPAVSAQSGQTSSTMTSGQSGQTSLPIPTHRHSLARGTTIGISFAAAIVALLLGCAGLLFCYRRRRHAQAVSSAPYENNGSGILAVEGRHKDQVVHYQASQIPEFAGSSERQEDSALSRALERKRQRALYRADAQAPGAPLAGAELTGSGSSVEPQFDDVQRLMRQVPPHLVPSPQGIELHRRLEELGPVPEVIQALREMLHRDNMAEDDLPQYEERRN